MSKPIELGSALVQSIRHADLKNLATDQARAGMEALMSEYVFEHISLLEHIPIASSILSLGKMGMSFRDHILIRKILGFLRSLNGLTESERNDMVDRLGWEPAYGQRVGLHLLETLERIESHRKPAMVGLTFAAYARKDVDAMMLQRLLNAVERLPLFEIDGVREWRRATTAKSHPAPEPESLVIFAGAGLCRLESTKGGSVYRPSKTCEAFLKLNLDMKSSSP